MEIKIWLGFINACELIFLQGCFDLSAVIFEFANTKLLSLTSSIGSYNKIYLIFLKSVVKHGKNCSDIIILPKFRQYRYHSRTMVLLNRPAL